MAFTPTPILVVSSSVHGEGMGRAFDALDLGALEVIKKPEPRDWAELERIGREVIRKVKILANVRVITHIRGRQRPRSAGGRRSPAPGQPRRASSRSARRPAVPRRCSTCSAGFPADLPVPVVVAQHIADGFVPGLVSWLDAGCAIKVVAGRGRAACSSRATAYLAPTGRNMVRRAASTCASQTPGAGPALHPQRRHAVRVGRRAATATRAVGVLLTGMGADGAEGLKLHAQRRRGHDRAGRGDVHGVRHAEGRHRDRCGRAGPAGAATSPRRSRNSSSRPSERTRTCAAGVGGHSAVYSAWNQLPSASSTPGSAG